MIAISYHFLLFIDDRVIKVKVFWTTNNKQNANRKREISQYIPLEQ